MVQGTKYQTSLVKIAESIDKIIWFKINGGGLNAYRLFFFCCAGGANERVTIVFVREGGGSRHNEYKG